MIRLARTAGTFLPTDDQHQLLRASLSGDTAVVRETFDAWKARVDLDAVEHGSMRLLPLLYRNLTRAGIDDPMLPRLKGIYRQVWFRNQLILEHGKRALRELTAANIPAIVLKGAALVRAIYDEPALRPKEDFDVLVPREHFTRAVELLLASGWSFHPPLADPEPHFVFRHAVGFRREGGGELDLHWSASGLPLDDEGTRAVWSASQEGTLAPADQLLQICAHAMLLNPHIPPIRWAADAFLLLARTPAFPWDALTRLARARGLSSLMRRCLEYLRDGLDVAIPDDVVQTLARQERIVERVMLAIRNGGGRLVYVQFAVEWMRHALVSPRRLVLLPRFLRSYCRVDTNVALFRLATSRLALNTRRITPARDVR